MIRVEYHTKRVPGFHNTLFRTEEVDISLCDVSEFVTETVRFGVSFSRAIVSSGDDVVATFLYEPADDWLVCTGVGDGYYVGEDIPFFLDETFRLVQGTLGKEISFDEDVFGWVCDTLRTNGVSTAVILDDAGIFESWQFVGIFLPTKVTCSGRPVQRKVDFSGSYPVWIGLN